MTDFTELGVHCAAEGCNQQDFLPFTCDCCKRTFCLSHRSYSAHSCPLAGNKDFRAFVCPLCNKTVRFIDSQDPNEQWELHRRRDCNPTAKNPPKQRCPAPGCREVLGPSNKQRCARCGQETCLTHRFPDSHPCLGGGSWKGGGSTAAANRRRREEAARPMSLREKAAQKAAVALSKDNTIRATADRRRREGNTGHGGAARASAEGGGAQQGSERCPQCGAVFGDVGSLVNHVESYHSGQRAPQRSRASGSDGNNSGGGASSTCPICNECFPDVNHLLSHMESAHPEPGDRLSHLGQGAKNCSVS